MSELTTDDWVDKHVYDWLEEPASYEGEALAKEWLDKFTMPAYDKHKQGVDDWLDQYEVICQYEGEEWICSGASRLGDVWLKKPDSGNFYDKRVDLTDCTEWNRLPK